MLSAFVRKCVTLLPVALLAACDDPTGPDLPRGVETRTSSNVIELETVQGKRRATITATVTNDSDETVYYSYCGEGVSVRQNGRWHSVFRPVCAAILVPPAPIAPGGTRAVTLVIDERHTLDEVAKLFDPALNYRVDVTLLLKRSFHDDTFVVVDPDESASNSFRFAE